MFDLGILCVLYLGLFSSSIGVDMRSFQILRMIQILRFDRSTRAFRLLFRVIRDNAEDLLTVVFAALCVLALQSICVYFAQSHESKRRFLLTILDSLWYSCEVLTTLCYGDVVLTTWESKLVAAVFMFLGVGLLLVPTGGLLTGTLYLCEQISSLQIMKNRN